MASASRSIVVDVIPEKLFAIIADYARYPEFLPDIKGISLGKRDGKSVEVTYEVEVIKRIKYTLKMTEDGPRKVAWELVRGEFMKDNRGSWELAPEGDGKTKATYTIELKLGALVPSSVEKALAEARLPQMLQQFKDRAEKMAKG